MIILIAGASHAGKTVLAQKLLEQHHYPYLSLDHLKMGLIRSHHTLLTAYDDEALTDYLWPIVAEMIKTAIENRQNLIIEGCYIPFDWADAFTDTYLENIRYCCLILSESYILENWQSICDHACDLELRQNDDDLTPQQMIDDNRRNLDACREYGLPYVLVDKRYDVTEQIGGILWAM